MIAKLIVTHLDRFRRNMDEKKKSNLDELETLRERALFGDEDQREEAQKAYEKLRSELLCDEESKTS
jgi:hypothetical protein